MAASLFTLRERGGMLKNESADVEKKVPKASLKAYEIVKYFFFFLFQGIPFLGSVRYL